VARDPRPIPGAATRVFALLGRPVEHSLSPALHNAAFAAAGLDAVYVALSCRDGSVAPLMRALAEAGGGGNVTLPHKRTAFVALDRATDAARTTGACNTFWLEDDALVGDNTDVAGFGAAVAALPGCGRDRANAAPGDGGPRALILGAGGAARAAIAWFAADGWDVVVEGRSPDRVAALVEGMGGPRLRAAGREGAAEGGSGPSAGAIDLLVNATPLGLDPADPAPLDPARLANVGAVLDMTYSGAPNALERAAGERGVPYADGRAMLLHQAAAAFRRWWGTDAPLAAMREALRTRR
jgi:shikimate dehydrogenase